MNKEKYADQIHSICSQIEATTSLAEECAASLVQIEALHDAVPWDLSSDLPDFKMIVEAREAAQTMDALLQRLRAQVHASARVKDDDTVAGKNGLLDAWLQHVQEQFHVSTVHDGQGADMIAELGPGDAAELAFLRTAMHSIVNTELTLPDGTPVVRKGPWEWAIPSPETGFQTHSPWRAIVIVRRSDPGWIWDAFWEGKTPKKPDVPTHIEGKGPDLLGALQNGHAAWLAWHRMIGEGAYLRFGDGNYDICLDMPDHTATVLGTSREGHREAWEDAVRRSLGSSP